MNDLNCAKFGTNIVFFGEKHTWPRRRPWMLRRPKPKPRPSWGKSRPRPSWGKPRPRPKPSHWRKTKEIRTDRKKSQRITKTKGRGRRKRAADNFDENGTLDKGFRRGKKYKGKGAWDPNKRKVSKFLKLHKGKKRDYFDTYFQS